MNRPEPVKGELRPLFIAGGNDDVYGGDQRRTRNGLDMPRKNESDATELRTLENELRSRAKQQEALAQLGERALAEPDLERLLNDAVSTVADTLSVDFVEILELLPGGAELVLRAGFGWKADLVGNVVTGTSIPIMELLYVILGPYLERASLDGPNVNLEPDPVFNLSAALHELAANAIKHGSLSRPKGQLDLRWSVDRTARGMTLALDWVEKNGPPARRPRRIGFGTRLIDLVIQRQLNGDVTRSYSRKGLTVKMLVPLTHERWPAPAATAGRN
jgi:hypothetical protein